MKNATTKQRILIEAVKLFAKEGYEAVSVDQIANVGRRLRRGTDLRGY